MNLKLKYTLFFMMVSALLLAAFSSTVYFRFKNRLELSAQQNLADFLEHEWEHFSAHGEHESALRSEHIEKSFFFQIWKDSTLIFDLRGPSPWPPAVQQAASPWVRYEIHRTKEGDLFRLVGYADISALRRHIAELRQLLMVGCTLACLLLAPLSWFFSSYVLLPFRELADRTSELSADRLGYRFQASDRNDEFGILVRQFNKLLDRLETSFSQMKRFATQASHEFRTPLAVIQSQTQYLLKRERARGDYEEGLAVIQAQGKIMQKTISRLLFLSEIERLSVAPHKSVIDIPTMLSETFIALTRNYGEKIVETAYQFDDDIQFFAHDEVFASILNNLCENAFKYARTRIRVDCALRMADFTLTIDDDGPGIPADERAQVFEALYRGTNANLAPGSGLGLAMVKSCVATAQGSIDVTESPWGGARITVRLPNSTSSNGRRNDAAEV